MTELDQLRRLVEARAKATAGPWESCDNLRGTGGHVRVVNNYRHLFDAMERNAGIECDERRANGDFVALAGSLDLQTILAAWERDREELSNARKVLGRIAVKPDCKHRPCTNCCDSMEEIRELAFATFNPTPPSTLPKGTQ